MVETAEMPLLKRNGSAVHALRRMNSKGRCPTILDTCTHRIQMDTNIRLWKQHSIQIQVARQQYDIKRHLDMMIYMIETTSNTAAVCKAVGTFDIIETRNKHGDETEHIIRST